MAWITLAESDVQARITGPELAALKTAALAAGQDSPLPAVLAQVIQEVRGYVSACSENKLGDGSSIPQELENDTISIVRYRLATRLPVASFITEARRDEYRDAIRKLERVASCGFRIEQPDTPSTQKISGPSAQVVSSHRRQATRRKLRGL